MADEIETMPIKAWHRRKNETVNDYASFELYRNLDSSSRTVAAAYKLYGKDKRQGKKQDGRYDAPSQRFYEASRIHEWAERALAWDEHLRDIRDAEAERTVLADFAEWEKRKQVIRKQGFELYLKFLNRVKEMLDHPLTVETTEDEEVSTDGKTLIVRKTVNPVRWNNDSMVRMAEVGEKLGRLAAGMETDRGVSPYDLSKCTDEQLRELRAALGGRGRDIGEADVNAQGAEPVHEISE